MAEIKQWQEQCEDAMRTFVARVENGEVRSRRTYAQFKELLDNKPIDAPAPPDNK